MAYAGNKFCALGRVARGGPKPWALGLAGAAHNALLCAWSAWMFQGCARAALEEYGRVGSADWLVCLELGTKARGGLFWWSYVYYISKYYEFVDTLLQLLRDRPLKFLHVFHHAVVVVMAWGWLEYAQSLQVIALLTNTGVHVVMYAYYFLTSLGYKPGWKVLVTNGQIVQFVFSFAMSVPMVVRHLAGPGCSGFGAWLFNAVFNAMLLLLFRNFHRETYTTKEEKRKYQ